MIDFKRLTQHTFNYNLHTHTPYCDGRASIEAFVTEAIARGYKYLGFSPHSPIPFESSCNMAAEKVDEYLGEIARLRAAYGQQLHIYAGMEIDYTGDWGPTAGYFGSVPLDYSIGSVHFIPSFSHEGEMVDIDGRYENFKIKMGEHFGGDIEAVVRMFFKQMWSMVESGGFDIVGHLDKIGYNASCYRPGIDREPWYDKLVLDLIDAIMDIGYVIEINTKAWDTKHRFFPSERYFARLKRYGAPVIINSDAHEPALLCAGRDTARNLWLKA